MQTHKKTVHVLVSDDERESLKIKAARAELSVSNYIRKKLDLPMLTVGAPIGNKFALKKKPTKRARVVKR